MEAPDPERLLAGRAVPWRVSDAALPSRAKAPKGLTAGSTTVSLADNLATFDLDEPDTEDTPPTAVPGTFHFDLEWEDDDMPPPADETFDGSELDDESSAEIAAQEVVSAAPEATAEAPVAEVPAFEPDEDEPEPEDLEPALPGDEDADEDEPSDIEALADLMRQRREAAWPDPDAAPPAERDADDTFDDLDAIDDDVGGPDEVDDEPSDVERDAPELALAVRRTDDDVEPADEAEDADEEEVTPPPPPPRSRHQEDTEGLPLWVLVLAIGAALWLGSAYLF